MFEVQILTGNFTKARQVRIYSVETPFLIRRRNSHARTSLDSKTRELERDSSYSSRSRQARSASQELLRSNQTIESESVLARLFIERPMKLNQIDATSDPKKQKRLVERVAFKMKE